MLSKLMKHEWKATYKLILLSYVALVGMVLLDLLAKWSGLDWSQGLATAGLMLVSVAVFVISVIVVCVRYYKNLYRDEGYLTHVLPVTPGQLMLSKTIVGYIWVVISLFMMVAGIFSGVVILEPSLWDMLLSTLSAPLMKWCLFFGGVVLIEMFLYLQLVYFSITLGNLAALQKSPILFSILIFFGLDLGMQIVDAVLMLFFPAGVYMTQTGLSFQFQPMFTQLVDLFASNQQPQALEGFNVGIGFLLGDLAGAILFPIFNVKLMKKKLSLR